jgi:predicted nuclease with TOPRIM domain
VELVRIEVERFQKSMGESMDKTLGRIVDLETQLQEQHMDVETAVQLERLEEVERALIALDPSQFVRRGDSSQHDEPSSDPTSPLTAPTPFEPQAAGQS